MGRGPASRAVTLRAVVPTGVVALILACASSGLSHALHGYAVVVAETDPQSVELARALREQGVKVRPRVRGGSGPTAALVYFTYQSAVRGDRKSTRLNSSH